MFKEVFWTFPIPNLNKLCECMAQFIQCGTVCLYIGSSQLFRIELQGRRNLLEPLMGFMKESIYVLRIIGIIVVQCGWKSELPKYIIYIYFGKSVVKG
jgi:hypothetical protein